jgi:hypothetical protein
VAPISKKHTIHRNHPSRSAQPSRPGKRDKEHLMWDIIIVGFGLGLFLLAVSYAYALDRFV